MDRHTADRVREALAPFVKPAKEEVLGSAAVPVIPGAEPVALDSGNVLTGVLVSEDKETVTIKSDDGIARTFKRDEIEQMKKSELSLMPADLQKKMTTQDLVNVVEYLMTLKRAQK